MFYTRCYTRNKNQKTKNHMNRSHARKSPGNSRKKYQTTTQKRELKNYSISKNKEYLGQTLRVSHGNLVVGGGGGGGGETPPRLARIGPG